MQIREIFPATTLIRRVMKAHGKRAFTNKYEKCRTVKCYAPDNSVQEADLVADIRAVLDRAGYTNFTFGKSVKTKWSPAAGLIVRIPL